MQGGGPGTSPKAGLTNRSSEALGRADRRDARRDGAPSRRQRAWALGFVALVLAAWGAWELVAALV